MTIDFTDHSGGLKYGEGRSDLHGGRVDQGRQLLNRTVNLTAIREHPILELVAWKIEVDRLSNYRGNHSIHGSTDGIGNIVFARSRELTIDTVW